VEVVLGEYAGGGSFALAADGLRLLRLMVIDVRAEIGGLSGFACLEPDDVEVDDRDNVELDVFEFFLVILAFMELKKPVLGVMFGVQLL
jgi:hypothetical protein